MAIFDILNTPWLNENADLLKTLGAILSPVLGGVGWLFGRGFERRKARRKTARLACKSLRVVLADWHNAIVDAVMESKSRDDILQRLRSIQAKERFEPLVRNCRDEMAKVKDCTSAIEMIPIFTDKVYEVKAQVRMAVNAPKFVRNPEGEKAAVVRAVVDAFLPRYKELDEELGRLIVRLG